MPAAFRWTSELIADAERLAVGRTWADVAAALSPRVGVPLRGEQVRTAVRDRRLGHVPMAPAAPPPAQSATRGEPASAPPALAPLIDLAKRHARRGGLTLEGVADALELSPKRARALVERACAEGYSIDVSHGEISYKAPEPSNDTVQIAAPVARGDEQAIAVASDLHFGSRYCLADRFTAFIREAYDQGARDFFSPGDILEGCYRHAQWEMSHRSWDEQAAAFLDALPQLPGLRFVFIDGNHDWTWTERDGYESGKKLAAFAKERGRHELQFLGSRGALVDYGGTRVELFHPKKGAAYALSYQLQNKIRDTAPERLPDILLTGHVHQYVKFRRQNVWAFYCGTFQHGDGPYGRSLGGDVATGGTIIRWRKDDDGVVRTLSDEFHVADHTPKTHAVAVREGA